VITIAISSQKGGVGKTTVAINLSHAFARYGQRTLLIDADPQGSVGLSLTRQSRLLEGFYDLVDNPARRLTEVVVPTRMETLSLIPAGQASAYEVGSGEMEVPQARLHEILREAEVAGYDVCIVDTAAGLFGVTAEILRASHAVLVPQQSEPLGIRSVPKMLEALMRMRTANPRLQILGVLLTMVQRDLEESRDAAHSLRNLLPPAMVLKTAIPREDLFIKASARGLPVGVIENGGAVLKLFEQLRNEISGKLDRPAATR
jgi:chromosome partitioning protein